MQHWFSRLGGAGLVGIAFLAVLAGLSGCSSPQVTWGTRAVAAGSPAPASGAGGAKGAAPPVGDPMPPAEHPAPPLHLKTPEHVRGIYLTGWTAGSSRRLAEELSYVQRNHLNTLVIDVKDDDGRLSFDLPGTRASAIGADTGKIADIKAMLQLLHANGVYVIGRVVTFADPYASRKSPKWAVVQGGRLWHDYRGISWLSPWSREARDYNIEIGVAAAKTGFDEIQYDYIRLPESRLPGYNENTPAQDRIAQVTGFLKEARKTIRRQAGVPVSADVFGITSVTSGDQGVGQSYPEMARVVDYISPMDYPSLYAKGEFGIPNPNARPYDTVWQTVAGAEQRTADLPLEVQRPWIQDYDLGWPPYGPKEVEAELQALAGAGIRSFLVWNAGNRYTEGVDWSLIDKTPSKAPNPAWLGGLHSLIPSRLAVELPAKVGEVAQGQAFSLRVEGRASDYTAELWVTEHPLPTNDAGITGGTLWLVAGGAAGAEAADNLPDRPPAVKRPGAPKETVRLARGQDATLQASGPGVAVSWTQGGVTYRVWGRERQVALDAANSMTPVRLLEGR